MTHASGLRSGCRVSLGECEHTHSLLAETMTEEKEEREAAAPCSFFMLICVC